MPGGFVVRLLVAAAAAGVLLALASAPTKPAQAAGTFNPGAQFRLCNPLPSDFSGPAPLPGNPNCTSNLTPGANPDFGFRFIVPAGNYNISGFALWISDGFTIAPDSAIPDGTVVGGTTSQSTLGLTNNPCNNSLQPAFILYDSTTDITNTVDPGPETDPDRFAVLATDGGDAFGGQADADSPAVLQYPSFLNKVLDPDFDPSTGTSGPLPPIQPHARYTGLSQVAGVWIFLTILVLEKTQLQPFTTVPENATHPLARYARDPDAKGWLHLLILQDPTATTAAPSPITDFCAPLDSTAGFLGVVDTDGDTTPDTPRLTSPAAGTGIDGQGTHLMLLYAMSLRDTDGDGFENALDTCPFNANVDDPPTVSSGPDFDMIDSACDPTPTTNTGAGDHDGDGFLNAGDNCPLVANATQEEAEQTNTYVGAAPDAGPKTDSIGDACDSEQGGDDAVADGAFLHAMITSALCIGGTDSDGDGWCASGADPDDSNASVTGAPDQDTDGDGYPNATELIFQTDPISDCPLAVGSHDAWPPDFDMNQTINILDVVQITPPVFGSSSGNPNYSVRKDLNPDGTINILDVVLLTPPTFGSSCTP